MSRRTVSLAAQWHAEATRAEQDAETHRVMAQVDREHGRDYLAGVNDKQAARCQGLADGLRMCARQLTTLMVIR